MDKATGSFPRGAIRVSDAERDQAIAELSEHFQSGRLTQEEFEDRSGRALKARTGNDLGELFTDLPRSGLPVPPASRAGGLRRRSRLPVGGIILTCVLVALIAGNVLGSVYGHSRGGFGWLVPAVILGFVFLRAARRHR